MIRCTAANCGSYTPNSGPSVSQSKGEPLAVLGSAVAGAPASEVATAVPALDRGSLPLTLPALPGESRTAVGIEAGRHALPQADALGGMDVLWVGDGLADNMLAAWN
jgi:hypothetical protein